MLNTSIEITIHGVEPTSPDVDRTPRDVSIQQLIGLSPVYATPGDILLYFSESRDESTEEAISKLEELIFNSSVYIDSYLGRKRIDKLTPEELFIIKREYVICDVTNKFGNLLNRDLLSSSKVVKTLGDFSVTRDLKFNRGLLTSLLNDAKDCARDVLKALDDLVSPLAMGFVKGINRDSNRRADRLWWHPDGINPVPIGANKVLDKSRLYKSGAGWDYEDTVYTRTRSQRRVSTTD